MDGSYEFFNLYLNKEYQFQFNVQTYSQSINARAQLQYFNRGNKKKIQKFKPLLRGKINFCPKFKEHLETLNKHIICIDNIFCIWFCIQIFILKMVTD